MTKSLFSWKTEHVIPIPVYNLMIQSFFMPLIYAGGRAHNTSGLAIKQGYVSGIRLKVCTDARPGGADGEKTGAGTGQSVSWLYRNMTIYSTKKTQ
jgi:hypothetical protein